MMMCQVMTPLLMAMRMEAAFPSLQQVSTLCNSLKCLVAVGSDGLCMLCVYNVRVRTGGVISLRCLLEVFSLRCYTVLLPAAGSNLDMFTLVCLPLWDCVCCVGSGPIVLPTTSLSCCGLLSDCQHHVSTVLSCPHRLPTPHNTHMSEGH